MGQSLIKDYKTYGEIICNNINANKNQKVRKQHACNMIMDLCNKLDESEALEITNEK